MYCEQCGAKNEDGTKFCTSCGANMNETGGDTQENDIQQKPKSKVLKKIIAAAAVVVILAGAGIFGYSFISDKFSSGSGYEDHPIVYAKDDLIYMRSVNKKEAFPLTETDGYDDLYDDDYYYKDDDYGFTNELIQVSEDGKLIFFADDISNGEYKLYYRNTKQKVPRGKNADEKGIRLASGVTNFKISPKGDLVIYRKGDRLYISDLKDEKSVSNDVTTFNLSDDGQKIIFRKSGGNLYICGVNAKDSPEKIDSDIDSVVSASNEYKTIYYRKDDSLYCKELGKDKVKVISDISGITRIGDTYFVTKENETEKKFKDLFDDDCAAKDAEMERPEYSDFETQNEDGYTQTDYDAYREAYNEYRKKEARDDVRKYYSNNSQTVKTYTLYKVSGAEATETDSGLLEGYISNRIIEKQSDNNSKIKLSDITSTSDARNKVNSLKNNVETTAYILKSDGSEIPINDYDSDDITNITVSDDEKYLYCIEDPDSNYKGTLNRYVITNSGLDSKEKIYDDVSGYFLTENAVLIYSGDKELGIYDKGKYTFLSDSSNWRYHYDNGVLYYYDQYSSSNEIGNLMRYENGKKEQVDIDVHSFVVRGTKNCYYIKDYSKNSYVGELYQSKGGKSKHIDSDVSFIIY